MMNRSDPFNDDIDWNVYNKQQGIKSSQKIPASEQGEDKFHTDFPIGQGSGNTVSTFLGDMPKRDLRDIRKEMFSDENITNMINMANPTPLAIPKLGQMALQEIAPSAGKAIKGVASKGYDYLFPAKEAEKFRGELGAGTSKETIEEIGKRVEFGKKSATEEALMPKREIYKQEGKSNLYEVPKEHLPEGNIPKLAGMIEEGGKFSESQQTALSKALKEYRTGVKGKKGEWKVKPGDTEHFIDNAEEIFNIPELTAKQANKVEDVLLMPTKRESSYFTKDVTDFYNKGLKALHEAYEAKPILNNYDALQSALKKEARKLRSKGKNLDTAGEQRLAALDENISNLDHDAKQFMQTLPEKMQNLERDFRYKYATGVGKYENAPLTMRKLAEGRWSEVSPAEIEKLFTRPTKEVKSILSELGSGVGRNAIYLALQNIERGNAGKMADRILELKNSKGYDEFITPEMEQWAHNMKRQIKTGNIMKTAFSGIAGTAALAPLGLAGGVVGAVGGMALPHARDISKALASKFKR